MDVRGDGTADAEVVGAGLLLADRPRACPRARRRAPATGCRPRPRRDRRSSSIETTRESGRVSSTTPPAQNCCPPIAWRPPAIETGRPRGTGASRVPRRSTRASRPARPASTVVSLSREWTSLTTIRSSNPEVEGDEREEREPRAREQRDGDDDHEPRSREARERCRLSAPPAARRRAAICELRFVMPPIGRAEAAPAVTGRALDSSRGFPWSRGRGAPRGLSGATV